MITTISIHTQIHPDEFNPRIIYTDAYNGCFSFQNDCNFYVNLITIEKLQNILNEIKNQIIDKQAKEKD